jgi:hypothetical protein
MSGAHTSDALSRPLWAREENVRKMKSFASGGEEGDCWPAEGKIAPARPPKGVGTEGVIGVFAPTV